METLLMLEAADPLSSWAADSLSLWATVLAIWFLAIHIVHNIFCINNKFARPTSGSNGDHIRGLRPPPLMVPVFQRERRQES